MRRLVCTFVVCKPSFTCSKFRYDTFRKGNKKGANQSAWMRRLVCTFVVRKPSFTCSKLRYDSFRKRNNKGAEQDAQAVVVSKPRRQVFSRRGPYASSKGSYEPVAYAKSRQSLRCSHTKRKEVDDDSSQAIGL